jgi:hypothetical protein
MHEQKEWRLWHIPKGWLSMLCVYIMGMNALTNHRTISNFLENASSTRSISVMTILLGLDQRHMAAVAYSGNGATGHSIQINSGHVETHWFRGQKVSPTNQPTHGQSKNSVITASWQTDRPTPLLEGPPVLQPFKNFPPFYGSLWFITAFTRTRHFFLVSVWQIHPIPINTISPNPILITTTRLHHGFS